MASKGRNSGRWSAQGNPTLARLPGVIDESERLAEIGDVIIRPGERHLGVGIHQPCRRLTTAWRRSSASTRLDERAWIGAGKRYSVLTDDMSVNHPAAVVLLGDKLIAAALGNSWVKSG